MERLKQLARQPYVIATTGLGLVLLIAGFTKFTHLDVWMGYRPVFVSEMLPLTAENVMRAGGVFELALGALLVARKRVLEASLVSAVWLAMITVAMYKIGLWTTALRDLGIVFLALTVAVMAYERR